MSNLVKFNRVVVREDNTLVIDSNKMVEDIIEQQRQLNLASRASEPDKDGFVCGLDAITVEQLVADDIDAGTSESARNIISEAEMRAQDIVSAAEKEAELIRKTAYDEAYAKGTDAASAKSEALIASRKKELEKEYEIKRAELQEEYERKKAEIEPELVDTLLDIYSKITGAIAEDRKDMILKLVDSVMRNADLCKEFIIKVSDEDYKFLISNKDKIYNASSPDIHIDICKDASMKRNQCIIETDAGVFDCSLDIQLENLASDIRLLSCLNK